MNKILGIFFGALAVIIGIILFIAWWKDILFVLRAGFPLVLVIAGVLALFAGVSETIDTLKTRKNK